MRLHLRRFASLAFVIALVPFGLLAAEPGLSLVPPDAVAVGVANLAQFRSSPIAGQLFDQADKMTVDGEGGRLLQQMGLKPSEDLDVVTFALAPGSLAGGEANVLVAFEGRFDPARIAAVMQEHGAVRKVGPNGAWFVLGSDADGSESGAVALLNARMIVAGSEVLVQQAMAYARQGGSSFLAAGGLAHDLDQIDPTASAWSLVDVPRMARLQDHDWKADASHPGFALAQSLKKVSTFAIWTTDDGKSMTFGATALSTDAETRQLLEDAAKGVLAAWRLAANEKDPELVNVIRGFSVKQTPRGVRLTGSVSGDMLAKFQARHAKPM
jgi:hypothetical protein